MFALEQRDQLVRAVQEAASAYVGISLKQRKEPITFEQYQLHRLGKYRLVIRSCVMILVVFPLPPDTD